MKHLQAHSSSRRSSRHCAFDGLERRLLFTAGELDPTFGGDGTVTLDFGANNDAITAVEALPSGEVLAAGPAGAGFGLALFGADGRLDTSFGGGDGKATVAAPGFIPSDVAIIGGKILVAGAGAAYRFNSDGTIDAGYGGGDGKVDLSFPLTGDYFRLSPMSAAIQPDGKIVMVGSVSDDCPSCGILGYENDAFVARFQQNGLIDSSFGDAGRTLINEPESGPHFNTQYSLVRVAPDGKIVTAGLLTGDPREVAFHYLDLAQFSSSGALEATYDDQTTNSVLPDPVGLSVRDGGGLLVVQETIGPSSAMRFSVSGERLVPDGTFYGLAPDDMAPHRLRTITALSSGGTLVGAAADQGFLIERLTPQFNADASFGQSGAATVDFGSAGTPNVLLALPDGRYLAAGSVGGDFALTRVLGDAPVPPNELLVNGTAGNDRVAVTRSGSTLTASVNGVVVATRPASSIVQIVLRGLEGNDTLDVASDITIPGILEGGAGNDTLKGGGGDDFLLGGDGDDVLDGRRGADHFFGETGRDAADYSSRFNYIHFGPGTASDDGETGEHDNIGLDVEDCYGGRGNDYLSGTSADNRLYGGGGNDTIIGGGGRDQLYGQAGNDKLFSNDLVKDVVVDGGSGTDAATVDFVDPTTNVEKVVYADAGQKYFLSDFASPKLHPNLQDPDAAYAIRNGVIRQTRTGEDAFKRRYISTVRSDYFDDFTYEITYTATGITFIGVGAGEPTAPYSEPARNSLYLRLHGPTVVGGRMDVAFDDPFNYLAEGFGAIATGGPHRARITRKGDLIRFEVDEQSKGAFVPEFTTGVDLREHPEIKAALAKESRLFFGAGESSAPFDDLSVRPAGAP